MDKKRKKKQTALPQPVAPTNAPVLPSAPPIGLPTELPSDPLMPTIPQLPTLDAGFDDAEANGVTAPPSMNPRAAIPTLEEQIAEKQLGQKKLRSDLAANAIPNKNKGWKGRLWDIGREAIIGAGEQWNRTGDAGAAIGGALSGGLIGGFNPQINERRKALSEIDVIDQDIAKMRENQKFQGEQKIKQLDAMAKGIGVQKDSLDLVRSQNKPLYDSVMADDRITTEEAALLQSQGFGQVQPYDARKMKEMEVNGETFSRPEIGNTPYQKVSSLPVSEKDRVVGYQVPNSDTTLNLPQNKVADVMIAIQENDLKRAFEVAKFNTNVENENIQGANKAEIENNKNKAEMEGYKLLVGQAQRLHDIKRDELFRAHQELSQMKEYDIEEIKDEEGVVVKTNTRPSRAYGELQNRIKQLQTDLNGTQKTYDEASAKVAELSKRQVTHKNQKTLGNAPQIGVPQMSRTEFKAEYRKRFPKASAEDYRNAVEKAKSLGKIKD